MKNRFTAAVLLLLGAAVIITGCGNNTAGKGAELIINNSAEPASLDPTKIDGVPEHRLYLSLLEGLVSYDPVTSEAVPGVAESWSTS